MPQPAATPDSVILIHGIWMKGLEFTPLAQRLDRAGFRSRTFHYPSLRQTPAENAERLARFIESLDAERLHLVAHSLGGIVVLHLLSRYTSLPPGRVVFIGTPAQGSEAARGLAARGPLRSLLGRSVRDGLVGGAPDWPGTRELGVIAGDVPMGVGRVLADIPSPNDGTVAVSETRLAGAADFRLIHGSHLSLLFMEETAAEVVSFLHTGRFRASSEAREK